MIKDLAGSWVDLVRSLGDALLEVLRAEAEVLGKELGEAGKQAGIGTALLAAAGMILFWFIAVMTLFLIAVLTLWMPTWAAAGLVALLLLLVAAALAGLGWSRFRRLENPKDTVGRRWEDHRSWWEGRLLASAEGPDELAAGAADDGDETANDPGDDA